ncbi:predicted protein [Plenodomus lingam JN3]|uniref:Predicted protein n=2 Tax=Leptosphaeria maculans TaxID=5022 RepID=E5ADM5_LEPMJ|nr:predicted protein [Plenodomus lingam JN3]CBY01314.1 predicted protein [Plenodomus lingam JN3]
MPHYWTFPAQGISAVLPPNSQRSDLTIRQYLNISAAYPPSSGFGTVAPYAGDVIEIAWRTEEHVSLERSWHCMPCRQTNLHNRTHEEFDWESCTYDESPPRLFSLPIHLDSPQKPTGSHHTSPLTLRWPYELQSRALLCTFTIPGIFPAGLSIAFPFLNTDPPPGRGPHVFTRDAMRGVPVVLYRPDGTKGGWVLGFLLLLVLVGGALAGRRFWVGRAVEVLREGMERVRGRGCRFGFQSALFIGPSVLKVFGLVWFQVDVLVQSQSL